MIFIAIVPSIISALLFSLELSYRENFRNEWKEDKEKKATGNCSNSLKNSCPYELLVSWSLL